MPDKDRKNTKQSAGEKNLDGMEKDTEQPLNPRIVEGLNSLYDGIVNDPIPDKIANVLDKLREEERKLEADKAIKDEGNADDDA